LRLGKDEGTEPTEITQPGTYVLKVSEVITLPIADCETAIALGSVGGDGRSSAVQLVNQEVKTAWKCFG
jgi:hypothetical protein